MTGELSSTYKPNSWTGVIAQVAGLAFVAALFMRPMGKFAALLVTWLTALTVVDYMYRRWRS